MSRNESQCVGCGQPLPLEASTRGRRQRYHGPACRQRARRARLHASDQHRETLAALERAESVIARLRRAVLAGGSVNMNGVVTLLDTARALQDEVSSDEGEDVTETVTTSAAASGQDELPLDVTECVTENVEGAEGEQDSSAALVDASPQSGRQVEEQQPSVDGGEFRAVGAAERIDLDSVHQARTADGRTRVLATSRRGDFVLVGFLQRASTGRKWQPYSAHMARVNRPQRTKQDALLRLIESHQ